MGLIIDEYMKREKYRLTTEDFIKRAKSIHGDKYDYSKTVYKNKRTKVIITCPIHGDFEQNPHNHVSQKQGCPICGKEVAKKREGNYKNRRKTTEEFKKELEIISNGKYELLSEYVNNRTKVKIFCHNKNKNGIEHGIFYIKPIDIINGHRCKRCVHSKLEEEIETFLIENSIKYEHEKRFKDWLGQQHLDFFLSDYNVAIECQGRQHFEAVDFSGHGIEAAKERFKRVKKLDAIKRRLCKKQGIKLLYFVDKDKHIINKNCFTDKQKLLEEIKK